MSALCFVRHLNHALLRAERTVKEAAEEVKRVATEAKRAATTGKGNCGQKCKSPEEAGAPEPKSKAA